MPRTRAQAFDEWMRRYIHEPDRFEAEWRTITTFLQENDAGSEPSYGQKCDAYLADLERGDEKSDNESSVST